MPAFHTLHPQAMAVEQLVDRLGQVPVLLKIIQRASRQTGQLRLNGQSQGPLKPVEFLLQLFQGGVGFRGSEWLRVHSLGGSPSRGVGEAKRPGAVGSAGKRAERNAKSR